MQIQEEFEDTKGVIRILISKKNRQHNDQKKKEKRTNNDVQNKHIKQYYITYLKIDNNTQKFMFIFLRLNIYSQTCPCGHLY
jgi:hypothetical protein